MRLAPLLLLLSLTGCDQLQGLLGGAEAPKPSAPAPTPGGTAEASPTGTPVEIVRKQLARGKTAEALTKAQELLAATPADDELWDLVELCARRAHAEASVLDALSADQPLGGRADRHQGLRARLALAAGRPADALAAARALETVAPGDAAAYTWLAVKAGAPSPAPGSVGAASAALLAATGPTLPPEVESLPGPRAAMVRARLRAAAGELAAADKELVGIAGAGLLLRAEVAALRLEVGYDAAAALDAALALAKELRQGGDPVGASELLAGARGPAVCLRRGDELLAALTELRKAVGESKNEEGTAWVAAAQAEVALRAGQPLVAKEAATVASAQAPTKARAQWALALSAAMLGDSAGVAAAATGLPGNRVAAVRDLAAAMHGRNPALPSAGLEGDDAAMQALLGAPWTAEPAKTYAAAEAAARSTDLRLWAQLSAGHKPVATTASKALAAENNVRSWLADAGRPPVASLVDVDAPMIAVWNQALTHQPSPTDGGLAALGRLPQKLASADDVGTAAEVATLSTVVPRWRSGPLAPLLALEGPAPGDLGPLHRSITTLPGGAAATALHGWIQGANLDALMWAHGVSTLPPAALPEARAAVWDAAAHLRAQQLGWLVGGGAYPTEAAQALSDAAGKAGLPNTPPPSITQLRERLPKSAVLSFVPLDGGYELLAISPERAGAFVIPASAGEDVLAYVAELRAGRAPLGLGDRVRAQVLDVARDVLTGVGIYVVVGQDAVADVPVAQLPEQVDGRRYLQSIRHVGRVGDLNSVFPPSFPPHDYSVTALALVPRADDAVVVNRSWPDVVVKAAEEATPANWSEVATQARYAFIGPFPAAPGGGFTLSGGATLEVSDLASSPLGLMAVVVQAPSDGRTALVRATALRRAGAGDVLLTLERPPAAFEQIVLTNFLDGVAKRKAATRSLGEARGQAIRLSPEGGGPGGWGNYLLYSSI